MPSFPIKALPWPLDMIWSPLRTSLFLPRINYWSPPVSAWLSRRATTEESLPGLAWQSRISSMSEQELLTLITEEKLRYFCSTFLSRISRLSKGTELLSWFWRRLEMLRFTRSMTWTQLRDKTEGLGRLESKRSNKINVIKFIFL
jgi:hypothetical protein